ncbi:MAG: DUF4105 domain-containing protein [Tannerella sp.]|jgi:hypothetical protein|nr:DUF4105 domain-containing protein [Tannerella sp.]
MPGRFISAATTGLHVTAQAQPLTPQAQISLLTSSPNDDDVYTVYGHTALRVYDPGMSIDLVFNYGIFDFSKPNFIYRFAKGETDYQVRAYDFKDYLTDYTERGSEVYEQVLNLLPEEKEALWQALVLNERPENRVYRYNFFFDNCATRPVVMIENSIRGTIRYPSQTEQPTFREAINHCTRNHPWTTFGCDLIMGAPTDQVMTLKETFFLPEYLKEAFDKSEIVRNGVAQPLVLKVNIQAKETQVRKAPPPFFVSPPFCSTLFLILLLALTWSEWRKKTYDRWLDCLLFFIAGIAGCILFFLSFISIHPGMFPNISLLWLHPFHLIGVILFSVKKFNNMAFCYHFINFAVILIMAVAWIFIPQHFNPAFIPLIMSLWLRSGMTLLRRK